MRNKPDLRRKKAVQAFEGEVLKTFGAKGELVIRFDRNSPENVDLKAPVFILIDGLPAPFYFKSFERSGNKVKVIFENMESEDLASELVGKRFSSGETNVLKSSVARGTPELAYLISFSVYDKNLGKIGIITDFYDYPGNPCFEVLNGDKQFLIPVNENIILEINTTDKILITDLPEGLIGI
jgi:16S rRNA processing protein RimM